jgi:hypothetical protein
MVDTQGNNINAEEIGYTSYNKLNMFMTTLLVGFSISFAILGDMVNINNPFTSMGDWDWNTIGIVFGITVGFFASIFFGLGPMLKDIIIKNQIFIAAFISILSIGGIGHLLLPLIGAFILDGILVLLVIAGLIPGFSSAYRTVTEFISSKFSPIYRMLTETRPPKHRPPESRISNITLTIIFLSPVFLTIIIIIVAAIRGLPSPFS